MTMMVVARTKGMVVEMAIEKTGRMKMAQCEGERSNGAA